MIKKLFIIIFLAAVISYGQTSYDLNNKYALSQSYIQAGQYDKAKPLLEELYRLQPENYQFFQSLNTVYVQLKDYDASIALIENKIKISNQDINLYGLLGTDYYIKGDENKAFGVWDEGLKVVPQSEINYRLIANYAIERRAFDKAIDYLKKGQDISQNPIVFAYDLGNLYTLTMRYKDATEEYCMILSRTPEQFGLVESRVLNYVNKPDALNQAIDVVDKYAQSDNVVFKLLLGKLYIEDKNYDKAYSVYQKVDDVKNDQGIQLINFAQSMYDSKIYETAAKVYNDVIEKYPHSQFISGAKLGYAKALEKIILEDTSADTSGWKPFYQPVKVSSERAGKVISAYSDIADSYKSSETANEALLRIGEIKLFKLDDIAGAEKYFEQLVNDSPLSQYAAQAYVDLGKAGLIKGDTSKSAAFFKAVLFPSSTERNKPNYQQEYKNIAAYQLARINFFKGEFEEAKNNLGLILNNLENNSANDALELSLLMNTSKGDSSNLAAFASAEMLAEQRKFSEAAEKYKLVSLDPQKLMLQNLAMIREAEMELAMNNYDTAIVHLQKISDENEKNIYADKALYLLAKIYQFGLKDKARAIETYENLLAKFPNSLYLDDVRTTIIRLKSQTIDRSL